MSTIAHLGNSPQLLLNDILKDEPETGVGGGKGEPGINLLSAECVPTPPQIQRLKSQPPALNVTVLENKASKEVIKVKCSHTGGPR